VGTLVGLGVGWVGGGRAAERRTKDKIMIRKMIKSKIKIKSRI